MIVQVIRSRPIGPGQSDRVNRLYVPSKRLIVDPGMHPRRGRISGQVIAEIDTDGELARNIERIIDSQDLLLRSLQKRPNRKLLNALRL